MSALGTSEKGARNISPQLRAVGLVAADGSPSDLALDLRDDDHYAAACGRILDALYPDALKNAYDNPDEEYSNVANWFMRNARTGQATANMQAKLYLTLLKAQLPTEDEKSRAPRKRAAKKSTPMNPDPKPSPQPTTKALPAENPTGAPQPSAPPTHPPNGAIGPALHIDLQIHIAADASDSQIDAVFKSMAKHLYGRE